MKFLKYFKFVYLAFAAFLLYETVPAWNGDRSQSYLYLGLAVLAIFMFFFRLHWEKKLRQRNQK